jgi:DNA-binding FrmR family transcriptional regulator
MVENEAYCMDVLRQTSAVRAAIAKVENLLLERHLHHCVSAAIRSESDVERERVVGELVELFEASKR